MINDKLNDLINKAAGTFNDQEKLLICSLSIKLQKAAEALPHDQTIRAIANIVSKLENNNKTFISRGELKDLYQKTYTGKTKFAEVFSNELGKLPELKSPTFAPKDEVQTELPSLVDPVLANALASIFDKTIPLKQFSDEMAGKAKNIVADNLDLWNLKASQVSVESGNEHFIAVRADYETPKGLTSIIVPVEIQGKKALSPSVFMGNKGPQDLNYVSLRSYLATNAGAKLKISSVDMIAALTKATVKTAEISSVSLALTRLNASKENAAPFYAGAILGQTMDGPIKEDIKTPKSPQFESFAEQFDSPLGFATLKFGKDKVNLGRDVVSRNLLSFGIKNGQVKLSDADENTIVYAVSLNDGRASFKVPVKFANNRLINPELLICNGEVSKFNKAGVQQLLVRNEKDHSATAACSAQYGLKPNELIQNVREAMAEENYAKAEDALNILSECGNAEAYKIAFNIFTSGLSVKTAEKSSGCSMAVKNATSEYQLCSHTGLPLHKVYQDKHGHCLPLYRRAQDENFEVPAIMTSKVFG